MQREAVSYVVLNMIGGLPRNKRVLSFGQNCVGSSVQE